MMANKTHLKQVKPVLVSLFFVLIILSCVYLVFGAPQIDFLNLTPANNTRTDNTSIKLNFSITETNLNEVKYNWNGTNYTMYNDSLILLYNFDNITNEVINATFSVLPGGGNRYNYQNMTSVSNYVIQSGDYLEYDVYWNSVNDYLAIDISTNASQALRVEASAIDQNGLSAHPNTDISSYTLNQWYHRRIPIPSSWDGNLTISFDIVCEGDTAGNYSGYLDNIMITDGAGIIRKDVYSSGNFTYALSGNGISNGAVVDNIENITAPTQLISDQSSLFNDPGTTLSATLVSNGKYGMAYDFDGVYDNITIPSTFGIGTGNFAVAAWVNLGSTTEGGAFVKIGGGARGFGIGVGATSYDDLGNDLIFIYETNRWVDTNQAIGTGWHHVAMIINSTGHPEGFIDGKSVYSDSSGTGLAPTTTITYIGGYAARQVNATIDEVKIWNVTLSSDDIYYDYISNLEKFNSSQWYLYVNQSKNSTDELDYGTYTYEAHAKNSSNNWNSTGPRTIILQADIVSPYLAFTSPTFDDATNQSSTFAEVNVSINESQLGNVTYNWNGTNYTYYNDSLIFMFNFDNVSDIGESNGVIIDSSFQNDSMTTYATAPTLNDSGYYGKAYQFNGDGMFYSSYTPNVKTLSFWMNTYTQNTTNYLFSQRYDTLEESGDWNMDLYFAPYLRIYAYNSSVSGNSMLTNTSFDNNTWYHVTVTSDGTYVKYYVNGNLDSTHEFDVVLGAGGCDERLVIGAGGANTVYNYFNGMLDEVRVWNITLNTDQVYQQYASNLNKFNSSQWYLYVNQSKNATDNLSDGSYTYQVHASDTTNNWNNTEMRSLAIDTTAPRYSLNSTNTTVIGKSTLFSLFWNDTNLLSGYIFSTNNSGSWVNDTWANFSLYSLDGVNGWQYRKSHVIQNDSNAGINYTIPITILNATGTDNLNFVYLNSTILPRTRKDFGDIRFTNSNGGLLDYWIETMNETINATFWVKISSNLSVSNQTIYLYYGNPTATNISNGTNTFQFFDDFDDASIDTNKWNYTSGATVAASEAGGLGKLVGSLSASWNTGYFRTKKAFSPGSAIRARQYYAQSSSNIISYSGFLDSGVQTYVSGGMTESIHQELKRYNWVSGGSPYQDFVSINNSISNINTITTNIRDSWSIIEQRWDSSIVQLLYDDVNETSISNISIRPTGPLIAGFSIDIGASGDGDIFTDWFVVRQYTNPEPVHGVWGNEETLSSSETSWSNVTKTLNSSLGLYVGWCIYANDTFNHWNKTSCTTPFSLITTENTPPFLAFTSPTFDDATNQSSTFAEINVSINESNLRNVTYNWNGTNYTMYNDSLILMYNFDKISDLGENNTNISDISKYNNDGWINGSAVWNSTGRYSGAFEFDGKDDYIAIDNSSSLNSLGGNSSNYTISFWIKTTMSGANIWGEPTFFDMRDTNPDEWIISIFINSSNTTALLLGNTGTITYLLGDIVINDGVWHNILVTRRDIESLTIYVDGVKDANTSTSNGAQTDELTMIGARRNNAGVYRADSFFNGTMDEFKIWNVSMNEEEVYQQYISNLNKFNSSQWYLYVNQSLNATDALLDGGYTYQTYASDNYNNWNNTEIRSLTIDTTAPRWESNETNLTSSATTNDKVYFNITLNETNPDSYIFSFYNSSVWVNDSAASYTNGQEINVGKTINVSSGIINWTWYFNDTAGNSNQSDVWSVNLSNDVTAPNINIDSPTNNSIYNSSSVGLNWSASDENNISWCAYSLDEAANDTSIMISLSTLVYNCTEDVQSLIIPSGVTEVTVELWGAGGGGSSSWQYDGDGASGGYANGTLNVTAGENLTINVGCGGQVALGSPETGGLGGYPGGGYGTAGDASGGGGGGYSGIFSEFINQSTALIIAAAGGGGTGYYPGGFGGGYIGGSCANHPSRSDSACGGGGSQIAGGSNSCSSPGSALVGGNGDGGGSRTVSSSDDGGGGGAGYFGGAGGCGDARGGGGGSGYLNASRIANGNLINGSFGGVTNDAIGPTAPMNTSINYIAGRGEGGVSVSGGGTNGSDGLIVISYNVASGSEQTNKTLTNLGEGNHNISIYCNDTLSNLGSELINFTIDLTNPGWQDNETNLTTSATTNDKVYFNITLNDTNANSYIFSFYNSSVWVNDSAASYTNGQEINVGKTINVSSGTINWTWYFNDTAGNSNQTEMWTVILVDSISPYVAFTSPTFDDAINQSSTFAEINVSINESNLGNVTYNWNGTNYTMYNDSLVLMYNFDNISDLNECTIRNQANCIVDVSNYENNGTLGNGTSGTDPQWNSTGKFGGAFEFDGNVDYIGISNSASLNITNDLTILVWALQNSTGVKRRFFSYGGFPDKGYGFGIDNNNQMWYTHYTVADYATVATYTDTTQWHMYVVTKSGTTATYYYDGVFVETDTVSNPIVGPARGGEIGSSNVNGGYTDFFSGTIDEFKIWNRSLTADEISQHYLSNLNKFNSSQWYFYVNQSLNATDALLDRSYTYQTHASDTSNNWNNTEIRSLTIDTINPTWESNETNLTSSAITNDKVYFNITLNETNPGSYIFSFYNSSVWVNDSAASYTNGQEINVGKTINVSSGTINWTWYFNDTAGNSNQSDIWTVTLVEATAAVNISVNFSTPTPKSGDIIKMQTYITINTTFSGDNVTVYLYNSSKALVNTSSGTSSPYIFNFTGLNGGVYYFNATTFNGSSSNSTNHTRNILVIPDGNGANVESYVKISNGLAGFTPSGLGSNDYFGFDVTNIGDLDNDGIQDLAVGAAFDENSQTSEGAIYILFMNSTGGVKSNVKISDGLAGFNPSGLGSLDYFGWSLENIGDLNNDGVVDLAVGAFYDEDDGNEDYNEGAIYILFLNTTGGVKSHVKITDRIGGFSPDNLGFFDTFGSSIANIGDLDGDGIIDLAVGAGYDEATDAQDSEGALYILFLNNTGGVKSNVKISDGLAGFNPTNLDKYDNLGSSVTSIGDLDGDGVVDLAVGAHKDEYLKSIEGAIYIMFMNTTGGVKSHVKISDGLSGFDGDGLDGGDYFGWSIENMGDLDSDGIVDLAVGAYFDENTDSLEGAMYLLYLNSTGGVKSNVKISDGLGGFGSDLLDSGDYFGSSITNLGDLDGNGVQDLVVGAYQDENSESGEGAIYILYLGPAADTLAPSINFTSSTTASSNLSQSSINAEVTATDENLDTIIVYLFNSTGSAINTTTSNSSPVTLNYPNLADGTYYVNATANDTSSNNATLATRIIVLDTIPPRIKIKSPVDTFNSTSINQNFTFNATDASVMSCILYMDKLGYVSNESIDTNTSVASSVNTTLNASYLINRTHTWHINCSDAAGNNNISTPRTITIDQVAPSITLTTPRESDIIGYNVYIYTEISDSLTDIDTATYLMLNASNTSQTLTNGSLNLSNSWDAVWNSSAYPTAEWNVTFKITVNDTLGNSYSINNTFFLDNENPTIQLVTPPVVTAYYGSNFNMNAIVQDITLNYTNYTVLTTEVSNSSSYPSNTTLHSWLDTINISSLSDGTYNLTVYALDAAENTRTTSTSFVVDSTPPSVTLNYPGSNIRTNSTSINFNWTTTDGIVSSTYCNLSIDDAVIKSNILCYNNSNCTYTVNGLSWKDYSWNVTCWDNASNINDPSGIIFTPDWRDDDSDNFHNAVDNLIGTEDNITQNGTSSLDITVDGDNNLTSFNDSKLVLIYDGSDLIINFTYNFSSSKLDLSNFTIKKNSTYILINHSNQLSENKTIYITDASFTGLCVKDSEIAEVSEMSDSCIGDAEYDFIECIGNNTGITINGIICVDEGTRIRVENLQYSAVRGSTTTSSSSPSGAPQAGSGSGRDLSDYFDDDKEEEEIIEGSNLDKLLAEWGQLKKDTIEVDEDNEGETLLKGDVLVSEFVIDTDGEVIEGHVEEETDLVGAAFGGQVKNYNLFYFILFILHAVILVFIISKRDEKYLDQDEEVVDDIDLKRESKLLNQALLEKHDVYEDLGFNNSENVDDDGESIEIHYTKEHNDIDNLKDSIDKEIAEVSYEDEELNYGVSHDGVIAEHDMEEIKEKEEFPRLSEPTMKDLEYSDEKLKEKITSEDVEYPKKEDVDIESESKLIHMLFEEYRSSDNDINEEKEIDEEQIPVEEISDDIPEEIKEEKEDEIEVIGGIPKKEIKEDEIEVIEEQPEEKVKEEPKEEAKKEKKEENNDEIEVIEDTPEEEKEEDEIEVIGNTSEEEKEEIDLPKLNEEEVDDIDIKRESKLLKKIADEISENDKKE